MSMSVVLTLAHKFLSPNSICSKEKIIKELHVEENHLKGTLEEQMRYNRKTLEELNGILLNSSNQVCNPEIMMNCSFPLRKHKYIYIYSTGKDIYRGSSN